MKIDIVQVENEGKNEFEVKYNDVLKYKAKLPFISIKDPFSLEKLRQIVICDVDGKEVYTTKYEYVENLKEEFIPMKYLVTDSQKFNQLLFVSNDRTIKIYYEEKAIWDNRYVIEIDDKKYFCYSIEDGYIRHLPIYYGDTQIGEALKSNAVVDCKDEYRCYLKEGHEGLSDGIMALLLYLDRSEYSSSYLVVREYRLEKIKTYNKTNKYYDKEWVKNNFGDEYYKKVESDVAMIKDKLHHPIQATKEQLNSMNKQEKKTMSAILAGPWIFIGVGVIVFLLILVALLAS